jgi:hypothetical protein
VFEEREEDLLGVITETAIALVGDDADDGAIGFDVRATAAPGDADAEGIAAGQIALDEGLVDDGTTGTDLADGTGVAVVETRSSDAPGPLFFLGQIVRASSSPFLGGCRTGSLLALPFHISGGY